jgi:hypothetical protein
MPPNIRRFLPVIIIAFFLLIVLPTLFRKHGTTGTTAKSLSEQTIATMNLVDRSEVAYKGKHGRYSQHVTDLLALSPSLGTDLVDGVAVQLDISSDGQGYLGEVASSVISLVRAREGTKTITHGCLVIKSSSGVACPVAPVKTTGAATTTTTSG